MIHMIHYVPDTCYAIDTMQPSKQTNLSQRPQTIILDTEQDWSGHCATLASFNHCRCRCCRQPPHQLDGTASLVFYIDDTTRL